MSSLPSTSQQPLPIPQRSENVILGDQSFVNVLLRATAGELYKIRRRAMSKVLLLVSVVIVVVAFSFLALVAAPLHLPDSLTMTVNIIDTVGLVLIIVLAGTIVGGEYGIGTIRVLLTRGPTRTQYLLAKVLAILTCIAITVVILLPVGILVGALYNLFTGIAVDFSFFTATWILYAIVYILLAMLNLFIYAIIALWLATLGKSTAAGIAGGILWWFVEGLLGTILTAVGMANPGTMGDILKTIPDYFVSNNMNALLSEQSSYLTHASSSTGTIPDWRAWLVIAIYLVVLLGTSWWVLQRRDITN
jgi:ABC-type transport system involved in multi-copper enzyme maturation permease subunit